MIDLSELVRVLKSKESHMSIYNEYRRITKNMQQKGTPVSAITQPIII